MRPDAKKGAVALSPKKKVKKRSCSLELLRFLLYTVTDMKQYQRTNYTTKEMAVQLVMPLNVETIIPEDESVRTLMRIAERID